MSDIMKTRAAPHDPVTTQSAADQPGCFTPAVLSILELVSEAVVTFDQHGQILYMNQAAQQISGWTSTQAVGTSIDLIFRLAASSKTFREVLPPPGGAIPLQILDQTGDALPVRVSVPSAAPAEHPSDRCVILSGGGRQQSSLQELRTSFIASITHECRTPLSALNASVEFLLDEMAALSKDEIEELLHSIHMSVTGLQTLIDNLLETSSIEAGMFTVRHQAVNIAKVLDEALQVMQPLLLRRHQQISQDLVEPLPLLHGDPTRIKQVLVNLLSNASKYGPINQCIEVCVTLSGVNALRISVADHGPGIPEADSIRLFKRFVRIHDHNGPQHGIGLGLAVVKAIVDAHGGQVGVEASHQGGSVFWFTLPIYGATHESIDRG